ncbi:MAG: Ig-like domain-containing protein, partial [Leptospira sp.]|nr:Ig-like domain-containing protein [Leptospira sp.]
MPTATITVTPVLQSITVTPANDSIFKTSTITYTAIGHRSDGSTIPLAGLVNWASTNTAVASITSPGGVATGVAEGTTTITATSIASPSIVGSTGLTVIGGETVSVGSAPTQADPTSQQQSAAYFSNALANDWIGPVFARQMVTENTSVLNQVRFLIDRYFTVGTANIGGRNEGVIYSVTPTGSFSPEAIVDGSSST